MNESFVRLKNVEKDWSAAAGFKPSILSLTVSCTTSWAKNPVALMAFQFMHTCVDEWMVLWTLKNKLCDPQRYSFYFEQVPF